MAGHSLHKYSVQSHGFANNRSGGPETRVPRVDSRKATLHGGSPHAGQENLLHERISLSPSSEPRGAGAISGEHS